MRKLIFLLSLLLTGIMTYSQQENTIFLKQENGKYGYVDKEGEIVIPIIYDEAPMFFSEDLGAFKKDDNWGFLNKKGEEVIPFDYDKVSHFNNGLAPVVLNGKTGYIDKNNETLIRLGNMIPALHFQMVMPLWVKTNSKR